MTEPGAPFIDTNKPGRKDVNGVEWWACDPYPTWFRRENGEIRVDHAEWEDEFPVGRFAFQTAIIVKDFPDNYDGACEEMRAFVETFNKSHGWIQIEMPLMEPEQLNG